MKFETLSLNIPPDFLFSWTESYPKKGGECIVSSCSTAPTTPSNRKFHQLMYLISCCVSFYELDCGYRSVEVIDDWPHKKMQLLRHCLGMNSKLVCSSQNYSNWRRTMGIECSALHLSLWKMHKKIKSKYKILFFLAKFLTFWSVRNLFS